MASARPARLRVLLRPVTVVAATFVALLASFAAPVPSPSAAPYASIAEVQARINALNDQAERITEAYDAAHDRLGTLRHQQHLAAGQLSHEQAQLAAMRRAIGAQAAAAYRSGGYDQITSLVTSTDPQTFLDQASMLDEVSRFQAENLADVEQAGHDVEVAQARYAARAAATRTSLATLAAQKQHIQALLAQAQQLLSTLRAADRARLAAASVHEAAAQTALRATYSGPASGRAAEAVRFAYAQLGKPYSWGAAGPDSYDCSGLTMAAWGAAGVSLPHNAADQQGSITPVSDLQPGDLVFFGHPAYHVGIYIGNGNMIHAPHTGDVVRIQSLAYMPDYAGAGRP